MEHQARMTKEQLENAWRENVPTKKTLEMWRELAEAYEGNKTEDIEQTRRALSRACNAIELMLADLREYNSKFGPLGN